MNIWEYSFIHYYDHTAIHRAPAPLDSYHGKDLPGGISR